MMKYVRMDYLQSYIDTLWCEFKILPKPTTSSDSPRLKFATSPEHLHIWPGKEQMFIAIPSSVRLFPSIPDGDSQGIKT
jgi:kynurenine 3-monooxygenase